MQQIHDFVKQKCEGYADDDILSNHILGVRDLAVTLAKHYNADIEVVSIAAYLHDISLIMNHDNTDHEIKGAEFAREYLKQFNFSEEKIDLICKCIKHHRGSKDYKRETMEEQIVACADAMDHMARIDQMFYRVSNKFEYEKAHEWIVSKLKRGYKKVNLEKAREMIQDKYDASLKFFNAED